MVGFWKNRQMDGYGDYPNSRFCPVASNNIDNNSAAEVRLVKLSTQNFEPGKNPGEEGSLEHEISPEQTSIENERQLLCQPSALPVSSLGACRLRKSERPAASLRSCFALALLFKVQDVTASSIHLPGLTTCPHPHRFTSAYASELRVLETYFQIMFASLNSRSSEPSMSIRGCILDRRCTPAPGISYVGPAYLVCRLSLAFFSLSLPLDLTINALRTARYILEARRPYRVLSRCLLFFLTSRKTCSPSTYITSLKSLFVFHTLILHAAAINFACGAPSKFRQAITVRRWMDDRKSRSI